MIAALYRLASAAAGPVLPLFLRSRMRAGKEDPARLSERKGIASLPRPDGPLVWIHAASVGETMSSLILIDRMLGKNPDLSVLVTTGTVTSAALAARRLPNRAFHQFCPVDVPRWVDRFLDHWRPDAALWIESELWPNLVMRTQRSGIPMALINARLSKRSRRRWARVPGTFRSLASCFAVLLCQTVEEAAAFRELGIPQADCVGNLKFSAPPQPVDSATVASLAQGVGSRPVWLAASTHPGEEEIVLAAHEKLRRDYPTLLTILVPRHPSRAAEIETLLKSRVTGVKRRTVEPEVTDADEIYIGDTLGEMGLFYAVAPVAYVGGGMGTLGGHNPIEPAQLNTAVLYGPDRGNFTSVAAQMEEAGAARIVKNAVELSEAVARLLSDPAECSRQADAAKAVALRNQGIVDAVMERVQPLLPAGTVRR